MVHLVSWYQKNNLWHAAADAGTKMSTYGESNLVAVRGLGRVANVARQIRQMPFHPRQNLHDFVWQAN